MLSLLSDQLAAWLTTATGNQQLLGGDFLFHWKDSSDFFHLMDLFMSPDLAVGDQSEESDGEEAAFGDFDSFLLGRDDINFICNSQIEVFKDC